MGKKWLHFTHPLEPPQKSRQKIWRRQDKTIKNHLNYFRTQNLVQYSFPLPQYIQNKNLNSLRDSLQYKQCREQLPQLLHFNRKVHLPHHHHHGCIIPHKEPPRYTHLIKNSQDTMPPSIQHNLLKTTPLQRAPRSDKASFAGPKTFSRQKVFWNKNILQTFKLF